MRLRHIQLDVIDFDYRIFPARCRLSEMSVNSCDCSIVSVMSRSGADAVFQRIFGRNDEIDAVKSGFVYQMPDYSQMAYVQRIK